MVAGAMQFPPPDPDEKPGPVEAVAVPAGLNDAVVDWLNPVLTGEEVDDVSD
jgi:hypothetical protein